VARKNPLDKLAEKALGTIKDPRGTADRLYTQAKGAGSIARHVADRVGHTAMAKASETAGTLAERRAARRASRRGPDLRPVPDVNEPAGPVAEPAPSEPTNQADGAADASSGAPASTRPAPQEEPVAPAASGSPATPADVAKAINKNGSPKPAADAGPGDKLPPRKKSAPSKTAKQQTSKKSASSAKKSAASPAKKSTTKKSTTKKGTGSAKKATEGSSGQEQGPPATDS